MCCHSPPKSSPSAPMAADRKNMRKWARPSRAPFTATHCLAPARSSTERGVRWYWCFYIGQRSRNAYKTSHACVRTLVQTLVHWMHCRNLRPIDTLSPALQAGRLSSSAPWQEQWRIPAGAHTLTTKTQSPRKNGAQRKQREIARHVVERATQKTQKWLSPLKTQACHSRDHSSATVHIIVYVSQKR